MTGGELVISLDFELLWGVRDHADREGYGRNILGAREAIPRILDLFARHGIHATWATVGFLFCENKDELMAALPPTALRPRYANAALSAYRYLSEVGADEVRDPYYFGASLIDRIVKTPGQEIGTHTLSHFYCLEDGSATDAFAADLRAAIAVATRKGITIRSIVFPRNQYAPPHLDICRQMGITAYRGNPAAWAYRPGKGTEQTSLRRALRLVDAHSGILGAQTYRPDTATFANVPASQFLRPCTGRLARIHPAHLRALKAGMTKAAREGLGYHLWWHPHNFGRDLEANLRGLTQLLETFERLRDAHGMRSRAMVPA